MNRIKFFCGKQNVIILLAALFIFVFFAVQAWAATTEQLFAALEKGDLKAVGKLLASGADPNAADEFGNTALDTAVEKGNLKIIELLLSKGANPVVEYDDGRQNSFERAAADGRMDIVRLILQKNRKAAAFINRAFVAAASAGHNDLLKFFLTKKADVNYIAQTSYTDEWNALTIAIINKQPKTVKFLLGVKGINVNIVTANTRSTTPLLLAAESDDAELAKTLLAKGAKVGLANADGWTPLLSAMYCGSARCAALLQAKGAALDPKYMTRDGVTYLTAAVRGGFLKEAQLLLAKGSPVNVKQSSADDWTEIFQAIDIGQVKMVELLIKNGADINVQDAFGNTPLIFALENRTQAEAARMLILHNAAVNIRNKEGKTALTYAKFKKLDDVVKLLEARGAVE